jgi:hypothetical protein
LEQIAIVDLAPFAIINSVAIAQIETICGAISPDGVLDEPRECLRKARIESPGINPVCGSPDNLGTASRCVTGRTIPMRNATGFQDAGAMQEIVDQRVNDDHGLSGLEPNGPMVARAYQQAGQRHRQDLVGHAENASERTDQGFLSGSLRVGVRLAYGGVQLAIDPTNEIATSDVPDEQKEGVGRLI